VGERDPTCAVHQLDSMPDRFRKSAKLDRYVRALYPGMGLRLSPDDLRGVVVPIIPLADQTPAFLVEWFRSKQRFRCATRHDPSTGDWYIERP
jgi:hypothetical protein